MSEKQTFPLVTMLAASNALAELIKPHIVRGKICGSVRRRKPLCADIEIVYEPVPDVAVSLNLLDEATATTNPSLTFLDSLIAEGVLEHRLKSDGTRTWGRENRLAIFNHDGMKIPVDLFAVYNPNRWGTHVAVRTGSADFNKKILNKRSSGGWMPDRLTMRDGFGIFQGREEIPIPKEEDFFKALEVRWIDPRMRHEAAAKPWQAVAERTASAVHPGPQGFRPAEEFA